MQHHLPTELRRAIKVALFDVSVIKSVAADKAVTPLATLMIILSSFADAFGSYVFPMHRGAVIYRPTVFEMLFKGFTAAFWAIVALLIMDAIANRLFSAKGTFQSFLRVVGYGYIVGLLGVFPGLAMVVGVWLLIVLFKALRFGKGLTFGQAFISFILAMVVLMVFFSIIGEVTPAHLYGGLYVAPY